MKKTHKKAVYGPLAPQYRTIPDAMEISRFASVEAVLHLFVLNDPKGDPSKAYLLFTGYQLIGAVKCTEMDHILQVARKTLNRYRAKKYWQDDFEQYRDTKYDAVRAFTVQKSGDQLTVSVAEQGYPYPYECRKKDWESFWTDEPDGDQTGDRSPEYATQGRCQYKYKDPETGEGVTVSVKLPDISPEDGFFDLAEKPGRPAVTISWEEILKSAEKMAEICPGDPCYTILKTNILKEVQGNAVHPSCDLTISEVVNMVGMVGSGKSTLMKVLAFWCHQNGYRMVIAVDTVAEVLNLQKCLSSFGISCSPLIGRNERLKYINQVIEADEMCLSDAFSPYLTPTCIIDGMDEQHGQSMAYGKEPCYSLKNAKQKNCVCPYFAHCGATRMLRECYTASVVVTTVAGLTASRVGLTRELFLNLVIKNFDMVIFDESDRAQKNLDQFFMPETRFNDYICESGEECGKYMQLSNLKRNQHPAEREYKELQNHSIAVLNCIIHSLCRNLGNWGKVSQGEPFSALLLLEDLYRKETPYRIPKFLYDALYQLIDADSNKEVQGTLLQAVLNSSCNQSNGVSFEQVYRLWMNQLGTSFERPEKERDRQIQDARIQLILQLIYFDHFIQDLRNAYEACHETSYGTNELFGYLQNRFSEQQYYLPSALCGNLFGLKMTDDDDIALFRQFAFGRSLMKDLPYLRTDEHGRPAGPHVILLSGSSWAKGSYMYHVNRPVRYILEADREKREFLKKTRFFESGFHERVSGSGDEERTVQLRAVTQKSVEYILKENQRKAGKILLVVNSYNQAQEVQKVLENELKKKNIPVGVCRMISDAADHGDEKGTIRRGEVNRFAYRSEDILIAPAMAIERGHNIVDETGHSALCAAFFLVRPMSVPDDIQEQGSKLNGYIESTCQREPDESLFAYNLRVRQIATQKWRQMNADRSFGLAELNAAERKDVVATLFILILQIFGRLARVTDVTKPEPHVYFMDGAFRGHDDREDSQNDFDCLSELGRYLDDLMTRKESAEIARTLYEPFYQTYRKDIPYESSK